MVNEDLMAGHRAALAFLYRPWLNVIQKLN